MRITTTDTAILAVYLLGMVAFGVWIGRRQRTATDFMLGGRDLPWWLVLFSIVATETSTVTFLSVPGIAFRGDLTFLQLPLGYLLGRIAVAAVLLPRYFQGQLFTAYQVLHERFGGGVERAASGLFVVTRTLGDGLRLFLSAIVLQKVAGIDMNLAIAALGAATIVYTFVGGIRAVVWTDFIQFIVYMLGAAIAFAVLLGQIDGGLGAVLERAGAAVPDKLRALDFGFALDDAYVFWAGALGGAVFAVGTHGVDQMLVQRYLGARSLGQARLALVLSGPVVLAQFAFFLLIGTALWAYYTDNPPATQLGHDEPFASFIVDHLPVGVLGVVLGAVFSAAMSTLSSSLNSSATALVNDVWVPVLERDADDGRRLRLARAFTVVFGAAQIAVGIGGQWLDQSVITSVLSIQGFTTGIILGVFCLGMATRSVGSGAALFGLAAGFAIMCFVAFGTTLAWPWYVLVGAAATTVAGLAASARSR